MNSKGLGGVCLFCCSLASASQFITPARVPATRMLTVASFGLDFLHLNEGQSLSLLSPYREYYTASASYRPSASFGLGVAAERSIHSFGLWQLGLAGTYNAAVKAQGTKWLFGSSDFADFNYNYQIQSTRVVAIGKILSTYQKNMHPYLSAELGAAYNHAYSYSEQALIEEEIPIEPFTNHRRTALSWGIGLGVDLDVRVNLRVGIGYQFADLGQVSLGVSPAQETSQTLGKNHLYDNQLRLQLTAFI